MSRSPAVETVLLVVGTFLLQVGLSVAGTGDALAASAATVGAQPWRLVTAVYAHAGPGHLLANAVGLLVAGLFVAHGTTRPRFHAYVAVTGAAAIGAELAVGALLGARPVVLGASGAVYALAGYALAGNALAGAALARLSPSPRAKAAALVAVVVGVTLLTGSTRAALVAHATGLALGLVAGRLGLLAASPDRPSQQLVDLERD